MTNTRQEIIKSKGGGAQEGNKSTKEDWENRKKGIRNEKGTQGGQKKKDTTLRQSDRE